MKIFKYPLAQMVGRSCGKKSVQYAMALALEKWAVAHGYKGYSRHRKRTKAQLAKQLQLKLQG